MKSQQKTQGTLWLEGEETLPLPVVSGFGQRRIPPINSSQTTTQLRGKRVWVVDDSPTIRAVTEFHLRSIGVLVQSFGDGLVALIHLGQYPDEVPSLILLDVQLPRMDGYAVLRLLRARPGLAQTAMVMMSGRDAVGDRLKGKLAGANDYLVKPIPCEALVETVMTYLCAAVPPVSVKPEKSDHYVL